MADEFKVSLRVGDFKDVSLPLSLDFPVKDHSTDTASHIGFLEGEFGSEAVKREGGELVGVEDQVAFQGSLFDVLVDRIFDLLAVFVVVVDFEGKNHFRALLPVTFGHGGSGAEDQFLDSFRGAIEDLLLVVVEEFLEEVVERLVSLAEFRKEDVRQVQDHRGQVVSALHLINIDGHDVGNDPLLIFLVEENGFFIFFVVGLR